MSSCLSVRPSVSIPLQKLPFRESYGYLHLPTYATRVTVGTISTVLTVVTVVTVVTAVTVVTVVTVGTVVTQKCCHIFFVFLFVLVKL